MGWLREGSIPLRFQGGVAAPNPSVSAMWEVASIFGSVISVEIRMKAEKIG